MVASPASSPAWKAPRGRGALRKCAPRTTQRKSLSASPDLRLAALAIICSLALAPVAGAGYKPVTLKPPPIPREFRAMWVATVYNIDWPSKAGLSASTQRAQLTSLLDKAASLHLNAVILQVRPSCDALYKSSIEPWSGFLTGAMGRSPSPSYDPLKFAVEEAHKRGLELHAWFNPFRARTSTSASVSKSHVSRRHPEWCRKYGTLVWLDPGEPKARAHSIRVITDVVSRYDIDGAHIDDYFYPYPKKGLTFPDKSTHQRYGGKLSLADWRRSNIDRFVSDLYSAVKGKKRWVKFGISPFGIWRPGVPSTIEAQLDAYGHLYADSRKWLANGWVDYMSPQLYWRISPAKQSFPVLYNWWLSQNPKRRHLWPGIATDRIGKGRTASEMQRQIEITRKRVSPMGPGHIHWNGTSITGNRGGVAKLLAKNTYQVPALVPASPWLSSTPPKSPSVKVSSSKSGGASVTWKKDSDARVHVVQFQTRGKWNLRILGSGQSGTTLSPAPEIVAVTAVNPYGLVSAPVAFKR